MLAVISNCWALLFGMALITLGNGLEATLPRFFCCLDSQSIERIIKP